MTAKRIYLTQSSYDDLPGTPPQSSFGQFSREKTKGYVENYTVPFEPAVPRCGSPKCVSWRDSPPLGKGGFCDHPNPLHDCPPDGSGYCWRHEPKRPIELPKEESLATTVHGMRHRAR